MNIFYRKLSLEKILSSKRSKINLIDFSFRTETSFFLVRTNRSFFRDEIFGIFFLGVNPLKKIKFLDDPEF